MSLLLALILEQNHILGGIYFTFREKHPRPNLKGFQYQIWTSVKISGKWLSSKTNFSAFLQISCSNISLKLCQTPYSYENCQTNQI